MGTICKNRLPNSSPKQIGGSIIQAKFMSCWFDWLVSSVCHAVSGQDWELGVSGNFGVYTIST